MLPILDEVEHVKLYARQIRDRELLAEASEFQMRAERRLGIVITAAKAAGHFTEGRRKKPENGSDSEPFQSATLEEVGVDKKLSSRAQKQSSLAEQAFENAVRTYRERIASGWATFVDGSPVNGARAIMGSRIEPDDSLDYFPTPPWATRALMQHVLPAAGLAGKRFASAWEPACGEGHIAEVLAEYADILIASDIYDYGYGQVFDFLAADLPANVAVDWIVTNPPFKAKTEPFVLRSLELASVGVAMFVRMQWLETTGRYERIFSKTPPTIIAFFAERVPLCKGEWKPDGDTATAYIWLVWVKGKIPRAPFWIPPGCRKELEHPADATRFVTHPVMTERREVRFSGGDLVDVATGEIIETRGSEGDAASEPATAAPEATAAGSIIPNRENALTPAPAAALPEFEDIPECLRRNPDNSFVVSPRVAVAQPADAGEMG